TFVFRFLNEGAEDLMHVSMSVSVYRHFRPEEDKFITRRGHGVSLDTELVGGVSAVIPSGLLVAFRTAHAHDDDRGVASLLTNDNHLAPTDLRDGDSVHLQVIGTVATSGTGFVAEAEYPLQLVQCGIYRIA